MSTKKIPLLQFIRYLAFLSKKKKKNTLYKNTTLNGHPEYFGIYGTTLDEPLDALQKGSF